MACNPFKMQVPFCQNNNEPGEACGEMDRFKNTQENLPEEQRK